MGTTPLLLIVRIIKLLWTFVPFIITVVFDDRPIRQVLRENISYTIVFILLLLTACGLFVTTYVLGNLRDHNTVLSEQYRILELRHAEQQRQLQRFRDHHECPIPNPIPEDEDYDPYRALRLLND